MNSNKKWEILYKICLINIFTFHLVIISIFTVSFNVIFILFLFYFFILGLNIEVSAVCGVLAAIGILVPGNDIAASALLPLQDIKVKSTKNTNNGKIRNKILIHNSHDRKYGPRSDTDTTAWTSPTQD